jgi:hypothetical protein
MKKSDTKAAKAAQAAQAAPELTLPVPQEQPRPERDHKGHFVKGNKARSEHKQAVAKLSAPSTEDTLAKLADNPYVKVDVVKLRGALPQVCTPRILSVFSAFYSFASGGVNVGECNVIPAAALIQTGEVMRPSSLHDVNNLNKVLGKYTNGHAVVYAVDKNSTHIKNQHLAASAEHKMMAGCGPVEVTPVGEQVYLIIAKTFDAYNAALDKVRNKADEAVQVADAAGMDFTDFDKEMGAVIKKPAKEKPAKKSTKKS